LPDGELPLEDTDIWRHNPTWKSLSSKFIIPPFSIRDSKQWYWAERKKIRNQLIQDVWESREWTLYTQKTIDGFNDIMGRSWEKAKSISSVSILDAVLAECLIRFFCVEKWTTFDPFAGDSVFWYVSGYLERPFKGIELRKEQSEINQKRCDDAKLNCKYYTDTSENMDKYIKNDTVDMVFSCPPYRNLERYSDDKNDLSNKTKDDFFFTIKGILTNTYKKLKDDCFACIVIWEVRDKDWGYINFVGETIKIMIDAWYTYYNEIIYLQQIWPKCLTAERQFNSGRKVSKIHQNILIFYKGNPKNIKSKYKELDFSEIDFRTLITKTDESTDI
jgi:DNA modification methylase